MDIDREIKSFLVNTLKIATDVEVLDSGASLVDDLGVDSAGVFELILWVEERFSVDVPPSDMELGNFSTIRAAASYVERVKSRAATDEVMPS